MSASKIVLRILSISASVLAMILVIFFLYRLGMGAYEFGYRVFTEKPMNKAPGRDISVTISKGMSTREIGELLEEKRLVRNGSLFFVQCKLSTYADKIEPGYYTLNTSQTAREIMHTLSVGQEEGEEEQEAQKTVQE
ncbi:endolytic transglycosylase MltG [Lachnospiraceae bacterium ZAX-1]